MKAKKTSNSHFSDEIYMYFIKVNEMTAKPLTSGNFFFIS